MSFLSSSVIVVAMAIVSACVGALGFLVLGLDLDTAAVLSLAAFCVVFVTQFVSWRGQDKLAANRGLEDLSRLLERATRDIALVANRVAVLETAGAATANKDVAALRRDVEGVRDDLDEVARALAEQGAAVAKLVKGEVAQAAPSLAAADDGARKGRFAALSKAERAALVTDALDAGRVEVLLQPIVTLPQRKIRWYEVHVQLRTERGEAMLADDVQPILAESGLGPRFDATMLFRSVQLVRRLQARNREVGLIVNLDAASLGGGEGFRPLLEFLGANVAIAPSLVVGVPQQTYARFGPIEFEALAAIAQLGYRGCLTQARDLRLDPRDLADRAFRFVKVPADVVLGRASTLPSDIHPADLADLLARYGVDLIADRIEAESTVVDLLDFDVRFGQGALFSPPRPVRAEIAGDIGAAPPERRAAVS
jgi:cyclic-di-GMP phosphodiesterase TipF (flagellum assembly factor)